MKRTVQLLPVLAVLLSVTVSLSAASARSLVADTRINSAGTNPLESDAEAVPKERKAFPKKYHRPEASKGPITRLWGIPDTEALVGHAFSLTIPKESFQGPVVSYTVSNKLW